MILNDEKIVAKFITHLEKLNKILKNVKSNNEYIVVKGIFVTYPDLNNGDLGVHNLKAKSNLKKLNPVEYIRELNGLINGLELETFIKENKKIINEINFENKKFTIKTSSENISYSSKEISRNEFNFYNYSLFSTSRNFKTKSLLETKTLSEEEKNILKNQTFPTFNMENYSLRITPKQFLKLDNETSVTINYYSYDKKNKINLLEIISTSEKLFECKQYYALIE